MEYRYVHLAVLVLLAVYCKNVLSWSFGSDRQRSLSDPSPLVEVDSLIARIGHPAPEVHQRVREFVRTLGTAPTCARQAAYGLVSDCANLADQSSGPGRLDRVKTAYAAKLAVCELEDAGLQVPPECMPGAIENSGRGFFGTKADPWVGVNRCAKALEARPQSWTSYSNSRQNALLICEASRTETERENMLGLFASLAENNEASGEALRSWLEFTDEQLAQKQDLAARLQALVDFLSGGLQNQAGKLADEFSSAHDKLVAVQSDLTDAFSAMLRKTSGDAKLVVNAFEDATAAMFASLSKFQVQGDNAALQQQRKLEITSIIALNLKEDIVSLCERQEALRAQVDAMQVTLQITAEQQGKAASDLLEKSKTAHDRLVGLESSALVISDTFSSLVDLRETIMLWRQCSGTMTYLLLVLLMLRLFGIIGNWGLSRSFLGALLLITTWHKFWNNFGLKDVYHYLTGAILPHTSLVVALTFISLSAGGLLLKYVYQRLEYPGSNRSYHNGRVEETSGQNPSAVQQAELIFRYYDPVAGEFVGEHAELHSSSSSLEA